MKSPSKAAPSLLLSVALLFLLSLQGCGIFDEGTPETARVVVSGPEGDFQLITTNDFVVLAGEEESGNSVYLNSADTSTVSSPYSKKYSLGANVRFFVKALSAEGLPQPVTLKVFIDDEERYNSSSTLKDFELEFFYSFR